ncbi:MAG: hypothetical protein PHR35_08055, partial [Kiritimatiellae bacterium]|nr:hypothetical protein [Kiritimatiellia bacterium]
MGLHVAGRNRDADLGAALRARAERLHDPSLEVCLASEAPLLDVGRTASPADCTDALLENLRNRCGVDAADYPQPRGAGRLASFCRRALWRLLRHP